MLCGSGAEWRWKLLTIDVFDIAVTHSLLDFAPIYSVDWLTRKMLVSMIVKYSFPNHLCGCRSDVYSFGVILWELSTLQQPWAGMNPIQV
jgi:hypothetical protein